MIFGKAENVADITIDSAKISFDKFGNFIFGFDRDDTAEHIFVFKFDNKTIVKKITPKKKIIIFKELRV